MRAAMIFFMALVAGSSVLVAWKRADLHATVDGLAEDGGAKTAQQVAFNKRPT